MQRTIPFRVMFPNVNDYVCNEGNYNINVVRYVEYYILFFMHSKLLMYYVSLPVFIAYAIHNMRGALRKDVIYTVYLQSYSYVIRVHRVTTVYTVLFTA